MVAKAMPLVALLCLLGLFACNQASLDSETGVLEQGLPDETSTQVSLAEYDNDRLSYVIQAERMERFTDRRMLYGYKVTLTSYDKNGVVSSVIKADTTIVDDARNVIFA